MNQQIDEEEVKRLLAVIERDREGRWFRVIWRGAATLFALEFVGMVIAMLLKYRPGIDPFIVPIGFTGMWVGCMAWATTEQKAAVAELAKIDDMRVVGVLLDALFYPNPHLVNYTVTPALTRLLPHLKASDAYLLTKSQRSYLHRFLPIERPDRDPEFVIALLKALEQVGTPEAVAHVEKLANGKGMAGRNCDVREAAQACLAYLKEHPPMTAAQETLLRAADIPAHSAEMLLRPTVVDGQTDPQQLLRTSVSQEHIDD